MPVHYFNQLGDAFVHFLLENIENPPSREHERDICDVFIGLVLSYNMQFKDKSSNVTVKCLTKRNSAKAFTEQVISLSVCMSIGLSVCRSVCRSVGLPVCRFAGLPVSAEPIECISVQ